MCVRVKGGHEQSQRSESIVLFKKMKAVYEIERPLGVLCLSSDFSTIKTRSLVICVHITVTLFCSHLCYVSHPYEMGSYLQQQLFSAFFLKQVLLFVLL